MSLLRMSAIALSEYIFSMCNIILSIPYRTPRPIIDSEKRIFALYAGMPFDDGYIEACTRICDFIKTELEKNQFHPKEQHHSRGDFVAINFGISQGNGKGEGTRLSEGQHAGLIRRMRNNPDIQRIASFQDSACSVSGCNEWIICWPLFQVPFNYGPHGYTSTTGMPWSSCLGILERNEIFPRVFSPVQPWTLARRSVHTNTGTSLTSHLVGAPLPPSEASITHKAAISFLRKQSWFSNSPQVLRISSPRHASPTLTLQLNRGNGGHRLPNTPPEVYFVGSRTVSKLTRISRPRT